MRPGVVRQSAFPAFGRPRVICFFILFIAVGFPSLSKPALGVELTLQWDATERAHGYVLHYGVQSQRYDTLIDVGPNLQHTVTGLKEGASYYFAVSAYNEHEESCYSAEISHTPLQNQPPTAHAGSDLSVHENTTVHLNGSNSFDPDDGIQRLYWEQLSGPAVKLVDQEEDICQFVAPDIGSTSEKLVFQVVVQDYADQISSATCTVTVNAGPDSPTETANPDTTAETPDPETRSSPVAFDENTTAVDAIEVQKVIYRTRKDKLIVQARIEGVSTASNLTAWAISEGREIKLGRLRYRAAKGYYRMAFRNLGQAPDRIVIVSSAGGAASSVCTVRR
jgi:hypothetical protein